MNSILKRSVGTTTKIQYLKNTSLRASQQTIYYKQPHVQYTSFDFKKLMVLAASGFAFNYYIIKNQSVTECEAPSTQSRIRGNYENKIRSFSAPEKIFETFASIKNEEGMLEMSYIDMLRCVTPYNFGEINSLDQQKKYMEKYGNNIKNIFKFADPNGNESISFPEFYFFTMLIQLNLHTVEQDFKKYGGKMTAEQFSNSLTARRRQTNFGAKLTENNIGIIDGRNIKANEKDFVGANILITKQIFKDKETITLFDYIDIRSELMQCLWHYEFHQYDVKQLESSEKVDSHKLQNYQCISTEDFARSIFIFLPYTENKSFVTRSQKTIKDHSTTQMVTFHQFIVFQWFLEDIEFLKEYSQELRVINKEQFKNYCRQFEKRNKFCTDHPEKAQMSDLMVDIIFTCLDVDDNGFLDHNELFGMLEGKLKIGQGKGKDIKEDVGKKISSIFESIRKATGL